MNQHITKRKLYIHKGNSCTHTASTPCDDTQKSMKTIIGKGKLITSQQKKKLQNIDKGRKIHAMSKTETCLIKPNISMQLNHLPLRIRVGHYK